MRPLKDFNIYVFKDDFFNKAVINFYRLLGANIYYWERKGNKKTIEYPPASEYFSNKNKSRKIFGIYFSTYKCRFSDELIFHYIKKTIVHEFDDYYAFIQSIDMNSKHTYKLIGCKLNKYIYSNKPIKSAKYLLVSYLVALMKYIALLVRSIYFVIRSHNKRSVPDIIYLRRKALPDALQIPEDIFNNFDVTFSRVIFRFSKKNLKYDTPFLSSFNGVEKAIRIAIFKSLKIIIKDTKVFLTLSIKRQDYYKYMRDQFYALVLIELGSKIIYSSFCDRNYATLIYSHKRNYQKICTSSDGFLFPPIPGPEYVYSDVFYSINSVDSNNINKYRGSIKRTKEVGFYRSNMKANSQGLTEDLRHKIDKHEKIILVALATVRKNIYYPFTLEYLENFIYSIIKCAKENTSHLFIIKGKKGEFDLLSNALNEKLNAIPNIYSIPSDIPQLLKYNHFEDLIDKTDIMISMHYASTTVWQALSKKIPVIAYCAYDYPTHYDNFHNFIVDNHGLLEALRYWGNIDRKELDLFFHKIGCQVNLFNNDPLRTMTQDMTDMAKI